MTAISDSKRRRILALLILVIATAGDAVRDAWISRSVGWWPWHVIKWIAFYSPICFILYLVRFQWWQVLLLAAACLLLWMGMYELGQWLLQTKPAMLGAP